MSRASQVCGVGFGLLGTGFGFVISTLGGCRPGREKSGKMVMRGLNTQIPRGMARDMCCVGCCYQIRFWQALGEDILQLASVAVVVITGKLSEHLFRFGSWLVAANRICFLSPCCFEIDLPGACCGSWRF